jgi:creatinine amidohydrolase
MTQRLAPEMRPRDILRARDASGCAFVPVSPLFEWHSYHLPMGCDGIIAESVARLAAEQVKGVYFPALSLGLDRIRPQEELRAWGFDPTDRVFGMNFPELPLASEYCGPGELSTVLGNRVAALRASGFRHVFIVNVHGGFGQSAALKAFAARHRSPRMGIHAVMVDAMLTLPGCAQLRVGGHAGCSETLLLMALRPDLVDVSELPEGPLNVRKYGILHTQPLIEGQWNPRNCSRPLARRMRKNIVTNTVAFVRRAAGLGQGRRSGRLAPLPSPARRRSSPTPSKAGGRPCG